MIGPVTSVDPVYDAFEAPQLIATNIGNEEAEIIIDPTGGLFTNEDGGSATFDLVISDPPTSAVSIPLSSSMESEGTVVPATALPRTD